MKRMALKGTSQQSPMKAWKYASHEASSPRTGQRLHREKERDELQAAYKELKDDMRAAVADLKQLHMEREHMRAYIEKLQIDNQEHRFHSEQKDLEWANEHKKLLVEHDQEKKELEHAIKSTMMNKILETEALNASQMKTQREKFESDRAEMVTKLRNLHENQEKMNREHGQEKEFILRENEEKMNLMKIEHQLSVESLLTQVTTLNEALMATYHEREAPESDFVDDFQSLCRRIDALARSPWDPERTSVVIEQLKDISPNSRRIKRNLLQDSIWKCLHLNILCSPFRVFGDHGVALETEWIEHYGTEPSLSNELCAWPAASAAAERWKAETIKDLDAALQNPIADADPRAKFKIGFVQCMEKTNTALATVLEEIKVLEEYDFEEIKTITIIAARMWTKFGACLSRLQIRMPNLEQRPLAEKVAMLKESKLELVIRPEVVCYSSEGAEKFQTGKVLQGCSKELVGLSALSEQARISDKAVE